MIFKLILVKIYILQDIFMEATVGFLQGVEKYEFDKNTRFSTYVVYWIKMFITRVFYLHLKPVRYVILPYLIATIQLNNNIVLIICFTTFLKFIEVTTNLKYVLL